MISYRTEVKIYCIYSTWWFIEEFRCFKNYNALRKMLFLTVTIRWCYSENDSTVTILDSLEIFRFCWVLRHFLRSYLISVASDIEREKFDKFCSEALISAWGSFTRCKSTTRDPRLYFPSEGSHTQDFYALKNPSTPAGIKPANLRSRGEYDNHWTTGVDWNFFVWATLNTLSVYQACFLTQKFWRPAWKTTWIPFTLSVG